MTTEDEALIQRPPPKPQPTTAQAMIGMLRKHYIHNETHPAWACMPEIQAPGPTGRRADLICLGVSSATEGLLVGHEVKVTRDDVLAELADLTKCDPWMRFCDRWWLVIPHLSLIEGLDIPALWGVMTPPGGRRARPMTVHRQAPGLTPYPQAPALKTLASWQHWQLRDLRTAQVQHKQDLERIKGINQTLRAAPAADRTPEQEVIAQIITRLGRVHDGRIGDYLTGRVDIDDVVAALKDLAALHRRRDQATRELRNTRQSLNDLHTRVSRVLEETGDTGG